MQTGAPAQGIALEWVDCGSSAPDVLAAAIARARRGDPLRRVTVVVPTKVAGLGLRRALAARPGGSVGVQFEVLEQVAEHLATSALAVAGSRPLTPEVHQVLVAEAARRRPGPLGELATNPATLEALDDAIRHLRRSIAGIDPAPFLAALRSSDGGQPGIRSALADIYAEYRVLAEGRHHDEHDLALAAAATTGAVVHDQVGDVIVHLPPRLTHAQATLLRALAEHVGVTVLLGRTGDERADRVTAAVGTLLSDAPADAPPGSLRDLAETTSVVVAPDPEEEVRTAAREVARALHAGQRLDRIHVLYTATDPYASLVHELFSAAGLPHNGAATRVLGQATAARVLTELLAWHDEDHPRARLFDLLGSVAARFRDRRIPATRWDRLAKRARVIGGARQWDGRLRGFVADLDRDLAAEAPTWLRERLERDRAEANELHAFVTDLVDRLRAHGVDSWEGWSTWALTLLDHLLGRARHDWSEADREAEGLLRQRLAALAQLDEVQVALDARPRPVVRTDFRRVLDRELAVVTGRLGKAGVGVYVGPLGSAGHLDADLSIVLGASEGALPPRPRSDPFLPDDVVASMSLPANGERRAPMLARSHAQVDAQRQALARVVSGSARTILMVPRIDRRQQRPARPGPWVLELLRERVGRPVPVDEVLDGAPELTEVRRVDSSMAGMVEADVAAGPGERRLRALARHVEAGGRVEDHPLATELDGLVHGAGVIRARSAETFSPWDGNVAGHEDVLVDAAQRRQSPNRLARYATCPRSYLLEHVLGVKSEEEPRRWLDIDALDRGNLVHATLEQWVAEQLPDGPDPDDGSSAGTRDRLREIFDQHCAELEAAHRVGLPGLWALERRRLWRRLDEWYRQHEELAREQGLVPAGVEVPFGMADDALRIPTDAGIEFRLRGRIDRVDLATDGHRVAVFDYKTGTPERYRGQEDDITLAGQDLQLPVYGMVAADQHPDATVEVAYWHVHDKTTGSPPTIIAFDEQARTRTREVLDTMAAGIRAGVFPANPGEEKMWPRPCYDHCEHCPFTSLCPSHGERGRAAQRDLASPEARTLLPLVESRVPAAEEEA